MADQPLLQVGADTLDGCSLQVMAAHRSLGHLIPVYLLNEIVLELLVVPALLGFDFLPLLLEGAAAPDVLGGDLGLLGPVDFAQGRLVGVHLDAVDLAGQRLPGFVELVIAQIVLLVVVVGRTELGLVLGVGVDQGILDLNLDIGVVDKLFLLLLLVLVPLFFPSLLLLLESFGPDFILSPLGFISCRLLESESLVEVEIVVLVILDEQGPGFFLKYFFNCVGLLGPFVALAYLLLSSYVAFEILITFKVHSVEVSFIEVKLGQSIADLLTDFMQDIRVGQGRALVFIEFTEHGAVAGLFSDGLAVVGHAVVDAGDGEPLLLLEDLLDALVVELPDAIVVLAHDLLDAGLHHVRDILVVLVILGKHADFTVELVRPVLPLQVLAQPVHIGPLSIGNVVLELGGSGGVLQLEQDVDAEGEVVIGGALVLADQGLVHHGEEVAGLGVGLGGAENAGLLQLLL